MSSPFDKYLMISDIAIDPNQRRPRVITSDGHDISEYFHIAEMDISAGGDKLTMVTLKMYAAIGTPIPRRIPYRQ